jgi:large subunit ribosomal protein L13
MKYTIDAKNKRLGMVAQQAAAYLMGKNSVDFARNVVPEVTVLIENASQMDITDKRKAEKYYLTYSEYPGGQKKEFMIDLEKRRGIDEVLRRAVIRMLPKNKLQSRMIANLQVTQ